MAMQKKMQDHRKKYKNDSIRDNINPLTCLKSLLHGVVLIQRRQGCSTSVVSNLCIP